MPGLTAEADTRLGRLRLTETDGAISGLDWTTGRDGTTADTHVLRHASEELGAYLDGRLHVFTVPLDLGPPGFRRDFLTALLDIGYGETREYGDLARQLGVSAQAIGRACGANPLPILVPCHRVLSASGLGGYSGTGGIETKVTLLRLEGAASLLI